MKKKEEYFTSRWGLILATLGIAVGTGNIWRFSRVVAQNGGGSFLIPWLIFLFIWSLPLIISEFAIGKFTRKGPVVETMGLIMNFGHPKYRDYMISKTAELFDTYDIDGVFLDGTLRWQNSPDYSAYDGLVQYTKEIRKRYPEKLVMGEDGYDAIYGLFDLFHTSGGPLGLENYLLRYTRQFYYLAYPAENGSAGIHEIGWSKDSHTINNAVPEYTIPSISLFYGDNEKYGDQTNTRADQ